MLYVPLGWAHETATPFLDVKGAGGGSGNDEDQPVSIHLTLGIDTVVWGLTLAHLRFGLLSYVGLPYALDMSKLDDEKYFGSMAALNFGFLGDGEGLASTILAFIKDTEPEMSKKIPSTKEVERVVGIFRDHKDRYGWSVREG